MFLDAAVQECGQVAWFPQLASSFGFADIHSQISPAVNCSVVAPRNHLLRAKMEMFKIHIWTSVMFKVFGRTNIGNIGSLLCRSCCYSKGGSFLWLVSNCFHFSTTYKNSEFQKSTGLEQSKFIPQVAALAQECLIKPLRDNCAFCALCSVVPEVKVTLINASL